MLRPNILLNTDSYKASHYLQYPPGTTFVSSYIESRGGKWNETVFFGLQMFLKEYLSVPFTQEDIDEAETVWTAHGLPFNRQGWQYILAVHGGYLPIMIEAVPEGTVLGTSNALVQVRNTDPEVPWLTSYVETMLLRAVWYPTTVATLSFQIKRIVMEALRKTSDNPDGEVLFKLHDFGARGVSSQESAGIGGLAHLVNFRGTDTVEALRYGRRFYSETMAGFSIPAAEHSTITAWGRARETEAYKNMLEKFGGKGPLVAVVSDSYDIYNATSTIWGETLKDAVINCGSTVVVRPDSGDPLVVPVEIVERLGEKFGHTVNGKGFKVLNKAVRVIQGDGINEDSIRGILFNLIAKGWSAENIAFGMGGALLQGVNRDTLKFAMKASAIQTGGLWQDVYKDPVTDQGKKSKRGRQALVTSSGIGGMTYMTIREDDLRGQKNLLVPVWENGNLLVSYTLKEVRERTDKGL